MKIIDEIINKDVTISKYLDIFETIQNSLDVENIKNEDVIFFDIETTGLNVNKTNLYLIGYVYYKESSWHYCQLFGLSPKEEKELILKFKDICASYKYLIHFNGDQFDIPYINEKCVSNDVPQFLGNLISIDIYQLVKMYKKHLGLVNCKQKTIENLLGITREDKFNGGELIFQYYDFIKSNDTNLERNLLLHNAEDCIGMLKLLEIIDYIKLANFLSSGCYDIVLNLNKDNESNNNINNSNDSDDINPNKKYAFDFSYNLVPKDTNILNNIISTKMNFRNYYIEIIDEFNKEKMINEKHITLNTNFYAGTLKHFFKDIQNYYYVPKKDMAMHKTVAKYIDPSEREKAKMSNCFVKKDGVFLPIFGDVTTALSFKLDSKDTNNYILYIQDNNICINVDDLIISIKNSLTNIEN